MSTENQTAPAAASTPSSVQSTEQAEEEFKLTREQFNARLAETREAARRQALKDAGFEDAKSAKAVRERLAALEAEKLTEAEKQAARIAELEKAAGKATAYEAALAEHVELEFNALPKELQDFVSATTGDDPAARLKAINAAKKSGVLGRFAAPAAPVVEQRPANPATTAPAPGPKPADVTSAPTHYEKWKSLVDAGKTVLAAQYHANHARAIDASRPK